MAATRRAAGFAEAGQEKGCAVEQDAGQDDIDMQDGQPLAAGCPAGGALAQHAAYAPAAPTATPRG